MLALELGNTLFVSATRRPGSFAVCTRRQIPFDEPQVLDCGGSERVPRTASSIPLQHLLSEGRSPYPVLPRRRLGRLMPRREPTVAKLASGSAVPAFGVRNRRSPSDFSWLLLRLRSVRAACKADIAGAAPFSSEGCSQAVNMSLQKMKRNKKCTQSTLSSSNSSSNSSPLRSSNMPPSRTTSSMLSRHARISAFV